MALSLLMCKSVNPIGKEYKSEIKNPYRFNSKIENIIHKDSLETDYEYAATLYSYKLNYKKALSIWDSIPRNQQRYETIDTSFINKGFQVLSAKDFIINKSSENSLLILNEAHHYDSHSICRTSTFRFV